MNAKPGPAPLDEIGVDHLRRNRSIATITIVVGAAAVGSLLTLTLTGRFNASVTTPTFAVTTTVPLIAYPVGITSTREPSGFAPPGPRALAGYTRTYVDDFGGSAVPSGWNVFYGKPTGDRGGQFGLAHVVVSASMLQLNTWRDPAYQNRWVSGGLCQCGLVHTYGAYFIRSRDTGAGPNEVQLLWPANSLWPPEIDFNESGGSNFVTSWTVHYSLANHISQERIRIDMRQWHTWGIIWTPNSLTFTVDGNVWGTITDPSQIPATPMRLDLEQRAECAIHQQCPAAPVSMQVDWVAEYSPAG
jgi:Glycosyl hydrolases family 16